MIEKIISGGQTGVDRAALDVAMTCNISHGGWCPKGRLAELATTIPEKYLLKETESSDYSVRTKLNIQDSDGTLILVPEIPVKVNDGTNLTIEEVKIKKKPYLIINLSNPSDSVEIITWIKSNNIKILNIAGPRESQALGIYQKTSVYLQNFFQALILKNELTSLNTHQSTTSSFSFTK